MLLLRRQSGHRATSRYTVQHIACCLLHTDCLLAVETQYDLLERACAQPFVAVALRLRQSGHRVRIATHGPLRPFVERYGLEFFEIGGDPAVLAEFAVQSKGTPFA